MERKSKHFDMRLTPSINTALARLAKHAGMTKTDFLVNHIRREAKKKGVWRDA